MSDQEAPPVMATSDIKIVVDPNCTEIFVDGVIGATVRDGIVRMNLVNMRSTPDGQGQEHAVVGRLILSRSAVRNLHNALGQVMEGLFRRGDRGPTPKPDAPTPDAPTPDAARSDAAKPGATKPGATKPGAAKK